MNAVPHRAVLLHLRIAHANRQSGSSALGGKTEQTKDRREADTVGNPNSAKDSGSKRYVTFFIYQPFSIVVVSCPNERWRRRGTRGELRYAPCGKTGKIHFLYGAYSNHGICERMHSNRSA